MGPLHTSICRWGNSRGVCLPESVLSLVGLTDHKKGYPPLKERFSAYSGDYTPEEWATGLAVGEEVIDYFVNNKQAQ